MFLGKEDRRKEKKWTPSECAWQTFCIVLKRGEELGSRDLGISHIASTMYVYRALCPDSRLYDG